MFRLVLIAFMLLIVGMNLLSEAPALEWRFVLFMFGIAFAITALKVALDLYLHRKEIKDEQDNSSELLNEKQPRTFYDLRAFVREQKRRAKKQHKGGRQ